MAWMSKCIQISNMPTFEKKNEKLTLLSIKKSKFDNNYNRIPMWKPKTGLYIFSKKYGQKCIFFGIRKIPNLAAWHDFYILQAIFFFKKS